MATIFLDESGFTGQDLFNEEQQHFVVATLKMEEDECRALKQRFFQDVQAVRRRNFRTVSEKK